MLSDRILKTSKGNDIVASGLDDDLPMSVVFNAALAHLIQSVENICEARDELGATTVQWLDTDILGLRYTVRKKSVEMESTDNIPPMASDYGDAGMSTVSS